MANVYDDLSAYPFTVERLRSWSPGEALHGAVRGSMALPQPVAVAHGPALALGPSGAVGAGESFVGLIPVPAVPDVVWVLAEADINITFEGGSDPARVKWSMFAASSGGTAWAGPEIIGGDLSVENLTNPGTTSFAWGASPTYPRKQNLWLPLDPSTTKNGWDTGITFTASTGGFALNSLRFMCSNTRLLGYPANYWGTGALLERLLP